MSMIALTFPIARTRDFLCKLTLFCASPGFCAKPVGGSGVGLGVAIDTSLGVVLESPPLVTACIQIACRHHGVGRPTWQLREGGSLCQHAYGTVFSPSRTGRIWPWV